MPKICPVCGATYPDNNIFCATDGTTLRAADADGDLIGTVIADRYLVTDLLGEGGMGKVYLARHVRIPQQAAIKVLRPEQVRDASAMARFNGEAANATRIDHDRVARVYDFGETSDGTVFLAMEYVAGRTLKAILASGGTMAPRRAANVVRQIADGLDAAHRLGIVHRDLKPDNVMIIEGEADDGSDDRVKVVDFGIAKALGVGAGEPGLTRTGYVVGTPEFMSPEQLLGNPIDTRSDVYALAIVAYQCLTGHLPFDTDGPDRGMTARLTIPPRPLAVVRQDVPWPAAVQAVLDSGLARDPNARPATAGAFARSLAAAVDAWAVRERDEAGAATAVPVAAPSVSAGPTSAGPASAGPASAEPATVGPMLAPSVHAADPERTTRPARGRSLLIGVGVGALLVTASAAFFLTRGGSSAPQTLATLPAVAAAPAATALVPSAGASSVGGASTPALTAGPTVGVSGPAPSTAPAAITSPPNGRRPASAAPAATTAAPGTDVPPTPSVRAAAQPMAVSGRHTLDSITAALDPDNPDAQAGRAAVGALRTLLPRLTSPDDSAWALIRTVEANLLAGDQARACGAMRSARAAARSEAQHEAIRRYDAALECP